MNPPLLTLLLERSVQFGEFTLASGATSNIYIDVRQTALTGDGALAIGYAVLNTISTFAPNATACGGLTLGADPIVTAVSIAANLSGSKIDAIIVRKDAKKHGLQRGIEAPSSAGAGGEVVVVDDVITTAGSTLQAVEALREAGFVVSHAVCVVDREAGGAEALAAQGVTLHALHTLSELLEHRG
ncbi:MAG: orotate phosphoribosyltransferase [bacterium]